MACFPEKILLILGRALAPALLAAITGCSSVSAQTDPLVVRSARAWLAPDKLQDQVAPHAPGDPVELPFRWDKRFPGNGGTAEFEINIPPAVQGTDWGIFIEKVGNQALISVGDTSLRIGAQGDRFYDATKASHLLAPTGTPKVVRIKAFMQRQRGAELSVIRFGPLSSLEGVHRRHQFWTSTIPAMYVVSLLLMGGMAAGLWFRQRDPLYGCFSLAAFTGVPRNLNLAWVEAPIPWPYLGAVVAVFYAAHIALIARFVLLVVDRSPPALIRTIYVALALAAALACASFGWARPELWTYALRILQLVGLLCLPFVVIQAVVTRAPVVWAILAAGVFALAAGAHDLLLVREGKFGGSSLTLTPHAMFMIVLVLCGLMVDRYSRTVRDYRQLNATLAERVAQRESQLRDAFEAIKREQERQAVLLERQRMMREIHDGVGSQLVGILNIVAKRSVSRDTVEEHVKLALDEMRMAVDSLQASHDELGTVLATLRYRMQARLDAACVFLEWDVGGMPASVPVTAQQSLHFQRILLEAITNILKHAKARHIIVCAQQSSAPPHVICISVTDDGVGIPDSANATAMGQGMRNMRARALAVGATLRVERAPGGGTAVSLTWLPDVS